MIRKVYEVDHILCPNCGGQMRSIAFVEDYLVIDKIIRHLKLAFATEHPAPPHTQPKLTMVAEESVEYL